MPSRSLLLSLCTFTFWNSLSAAPTNDCQSRSRPFEVDETLFPFKSNFVLLTYGCVHYIDAQNATVNRSGTILAFHGNPVWSIIFTKLAKQAIVDGYRFIALDYYGYGMSDKPDVERFDYSIHFQSAIAAEFMRKLNLSDLIMVVQDGGGPIGLAAAEEESSRVKGLVIVNSWYKETKPIVNGSTNENFIFHDWSTDNIINEQYFVATGYNSFKGASGTVTAWGLDPKSPEAASLTRMILEPYFVGGNASQPRSDHVHVPHVRLVQSVLTDRTHFQMLEYNITRIRTIPAYFVFADPLAFSALRCDAGPRTRIDLNTSDAIKYKAQQLTGIRALCPSHMICSENPPKPFQSKCLNKDGSEYWASLQSFLDIWQKERVVGIYKDFPGHEYLSAKSPEKIMLAIRAVNVFDTNSNAASKMLLWNSVSYKALFIVFRMVIAYRTYDTSSPL